MPKRGVTARTALTPGRMWRVGYTLIELLISMGSASVLITGMGSAVYLSSGAFNADRSVPGLRADATEAQRQMLEDLQYATGFTERTNNAVTFTVPDRTGDGQPETIRYAWSGTAGAPLTYSMNGATPRDVVENVHQLSLAFAAETIAAPVIPDDDGAGGGTVLFVSGGSVVSVDSGGFLAKMFTLSEPELQYVASSEVEDERIRWIESWGYTVTKISAAATEEEFQLAYKQADVVYLPEGVDPTYLAPRLATMPLGIVNESPFLVDGLGFGSEWAGLWGQTLDIVTTKHAITEHLTEGPLAALSSSTPLLVLTDVRSPDLQSLGAVKGPVSRMASLMAINAGDRGYHGKPVATRRVQLPWGTTGFDPNSLSDDGRELMRRSIDWAMGNGPDGIPNSVTPGRFGYEEIFASKLTNVRDRQIATRVTLSEPARLTAMSAYIGGDDKDTRLAIYLDEAGEPGKLLAQTKGGISRKSMSWVRLLSEDAVLEPGDYWLAVLFASSKHTAMVSTSAGELRITSTQDDYENIGFKSHWGKSSTSQLGAFSIFAEFESP
ncbi:MAG: hypothetical protein R3B90_20690 [Planctomycetaceae bacterium]